MGKKEKFSFRSLDERSQPLVLIGANEPNSCGLLKIYFGSKIELSNGGVQEAYGRNNHDFIVVVKKNSE